MLKKTATVISANRVQASNEDFLRLMIIPRYIGFCSVIPTADGSLLCKRPNDITIVTAKRPPNVTSNVTEYPFAGSQWSQEMPKRYQVFKRVRCYN